MIVQPYLNFNGRCEEAIVFYRSALGAEVTMLMRFKDSPERLDPSMVHQIQDDSSFIETLHPAIAHPFKVGFAESMDLVFMIAAGVGVLAFLILLLLPPVELRATSASVAARAEAERGA